jgi:hypothetical protein
MRPPLQKCERGGRFTFKIHVLFYEDNSLTIALTFRETKFGTVKDHGHAYMFYLNHYFL